MVRDGHSSGVMFAHGLEQPTRTASLTSPCGVIAFCELTALPSLFGFAPGVVCHAVSVAGYAVRSYRTFSPLLPALAGGSGSFSVALSLGSPPPDVIRHRMSMEPGLSSPAAFRHLPERPSGRLTCLEWDLRCVTSSIDVGPKNIILPCRSTCGPFDWMSANQPNRGAFPCSIS